MPNTINAIKTFIQNQDQYILKVDRKNDALVAKKKNFLSGLAIFFGFESYKLKSVVEFLSNNPKILNQLGDDKGKFESLMNRKITHHNDRHPNRKQIITKLFSQSTGKADSAYSNDKADPIRKQVEDILRITMKPHMADEQVLATLNIYDQAVQSPNPRDSFINGVNKNAAWGPEKGAHIIKNIAPLLPETSPKDIRGIDNFPGVTASPTKADPIRKQVEDILRIEMSDHMRPDQVLATLSIYDQAVQSPNPRDSFINGVNKNATWGPEKGAHIIKNIARLLPETSLTKSEETQNFDEEMDFIVYNQSDFFAFYKSGSTEFLGNFAICPNGINVFGETFRTSEAAFQWKKCQLAGQRYPSSGLSADPLLKDFFNADGEKAFQISRQLSEKYKNIFTPESEFSKSWTGGSRSSLGGERDKVMWTALQAKFNDNPKMMDLLKATKKAHLIEHNPVVGRDLYWSDNNDGTGKNRLGQFLEAIRDNKPMPTTQISQIEIKTYANNAKKIDYIIN